MGFDNSVVQLLCGAKNRGIEFGETATLGRQFFFPTPAVLHRVLKAIGGTADDMASFKAAPGSETFLKLLGAREVHSIDYSAYENASFIQDLNGPLAPELRNRFDVLIDGGTMEHVFNVPQALRNAMGMVRVGGWFIQVTAANNSMGHGFWQFSPELMFRCFCEANGFDPPCVLLKERLVDDMWHECRDPAEVRRRVELRNFNETYICTLARKRQDVEPFATPPYQSDYVVMWNSAPTRVKAETVSSRLKSILPTRLRSALKPLVAAARVANPIRSDQLRASFKTLAMATGMATPYRSDHYHRVRLKALLRGEFGPSARASS